MAVSAQPFGPSFQGHVETPSDAAWIFRAVAAGRCRVVTRRFDQQADIICPGFGYVYDSNDSNIRRWTDGLSWGDSYHPGSGFMIYHEVDKGVRGVGGRAAQEKVNGLRKKAILDAASGLRLVYYYYESDAHLYGEIRYPEPPSNDVEARDALLLVSLFATSQYNEQVASSSADSGEESELSDASSSSGSGDEGILSLAGLSLQQLERLGRVRARRFTFRRDMREAKPRPKKSRVRRGKRRRASAPLFDPPFPALPAPRPVELCLGASFPHAMPMFE